MTAIPASKTAVWKNVPRRSAAIVLAIVCCGALPVATYGQEGAKPPAKKAIPKIRADQAPGYEPTVIEGFTVVFSKEAWAHKDDTEAEKSPNSPYQALEGELKSIVRLMPARSVNTLRNLLIWVEWDTKQRMSNGRAGTAVAVYYGGHQANMLARGKPALMAKTVTILSLKGLTQEHQPKTEAGTCIILHEMAHAVHDQLLGWEYGPILNAYKQAMERKLYDKEAYAATNEAEYFAEMSCAYYDQLDYFPRNKKELLKHDPVTFKLMESIWGKSKAAAPGKTEAAGPIVAPPLEKLEWGETIAGPQASAEIAKSRPTLVLFWNATDVSSLAALTKIAVYEAELRDFNFVAAAVHLSNRKERRLKAFAKERDLTYAINEHPWSEDSLVNDFKDFPLCLVYRHDGTCVYRGSPFDAEAAARSAVGAALLAQADIAETPKALAPITDALNKGKAPATLFAKLNPLLKSKDEPTGAAAKLLMAAMIEPGQKLLAATEPKIADDPIEAYVVFERLAVAFKDSSVAAKANEHIAKLKQNKVVALELKARPTLLAVKRLDAELSSRAGSFEPSHPNFREDNAASIRDLEAAVRQLRQYWPTARATQQANRIGEKYGMR